MPSSIHCSFILYASFSPFTSPLAHPWQYEGFICLLSLISFSFTALLSHGPPTSHMCSSSPSEPSVVFVKGCLLPPQQHDEHYGLVARKERTIALEIKFHFHPTLCVRMHACVRAWVCVLCLFIGVMFHIVTVMSPVWLHYRYKVVYNCRGSVPRACSLSPAMLWTEFELYFTSLLFLTCLRSGCLNSLSIRPRVLDKDVQCLFSHKLSLSCVLSDWS